MGKLKKTNLFILHPDLPQPLQRRELELVEGDLYKIRRGLGNNILKL